MKFQIPFTKNNFFYIEISIKPTYRSILASMLMNNRWLADDGRWYPDKIKAIKWIRNLNGNLGLREAKTLVEDVMKEYGIFPVKKWDKSKIY